MISHPAVAVISAAILAYEVLLVRLFAIVQWHHFAYMAIGVALLGFGVSGALLAVFKDWVEHRAAAVFEFSSMFFAIAAPTAFLLSQRLPFNALEVVWAPSQLLYLGVIYLLLTVPFTAGATCVGLAFLGSKAAPGRVYLWNLLGSGTGALGCVVALFVFSPMTCLVLVAGIGLAAAATSKIGRGEDRRGSDPVSDRHAEVLRHLGIAQHSLWACRTSALWLGRGRSTFPIRMEQLMDEANNDFVKVTWNGRRKFAVATAPREAVYFVPGMNKRQ